MVFQSATRFKPRWRMSLVESSRPFFPGNPFTMLIADVDSLTCDGSYITPFNVGGLTKYPTELGPNQVCTLLGSTAGSNVVPGRDYIRAAFEYNAGGAFAFIHWE